MLNTLSNELKDLVLQWDTKKQKAKTLSFFPCLIVLEKLKYSFLITLKLSVISIINPSVVWKVMNWSEIVKNNMNWCNIYFDMQKFTQMTTQ